MTKSDKWIKIGVIITIIIYIFIGLSVFMGYNQVGLISLLNLATSLSILTYWIQKQIRISQHIFEFREMSVLCFEIVVIGCAIYSHIFNIFSDWMKVIHLTLFGIHLCFLILFLAFMLTFKMKRLI